MKYRHILLLWQPDYASLVITVVLCLLYGYATRFHFTKRSLLFITGVLVWVICTMSPLHVLAVHYLFSAHVLTHTFILLIAAPLLLAGFPATHRFQHLSVHISALAQKAPFLFWLAGVGVMWLWHIPSIFDAFVSKGIGQMHTFSLSGMLHNMSLLLAGCMFYWPLIAPERRYRLPPLIGVLYLSTACICCSLLGLLIAFAPPGVYTHYITLDDHYGLLPMISDNWQISSKSDQQMAGLVMWVPCCFIYLAASMVLLLQWFNDEQESSTFHRLKL